MAFIIDRLTNRDMGWIAGFIEGEGCFMFAQKKRLQIDVSQKDREPLDKLFNLLGGRIQYIHPTGRNPIFRWTITGHRAAGIMMMIYSLMSERRRGQIKQALIGWRSIRAWSAKRFAAGHHRRAA